MSLIPICSGLISLLTCYLLRSSFKYVLFFFWFAFFYHLISFYSIIVLLFVLFISSLQWLKNNFLIILFFFLFLFLGKSFNYFFLDSFLLRSDSTSIHHFILGNALCKKGWRWDQNILVQLRIKLKCKKFYFISNNLMSSFEQQEAYRLPQYLKWDN